METRYGLWNGVSALFSQSGRQLGEENTRPFILNHHVPAQTIDCKYEGSRAGRAINMSALRIAMTNFDAALAITAAVRDFHAEKIGQKSDSAKLGSIALIAYQHRFTPANGLAPAPDAIVPDALASQYQFISGVFMICREMMKCGDATIAKNNVTSAAQLYSYADEKEIFISYNGMACAGSTKKIMEFLEANQQFQSRKHRYQSRKLVSIRPRHYRARLFLRIGIFEIYRRTGRCRKFTRDL